MKRLTLILLLFFPVMVFSTPIDTTGNKDSVQYAFNDDITSAVAAAIRSGDANRLASFFSASIDLTAPGVDGTYSKSQAEMIVKNFFSKYPPQSFTIKQQGSSGEGSKFAIGLLSTTSGDFRTYFLIKTSGGQQLIHQLQFEEE
jgi:hypothetical protein